jgi:hypothetical protein
MMTSTPEIALLQLQPAAGSLSVEEGLFLAICGQSEAAANRARGAGRSTPFGMKYADLRVLMMRNGGGK